MGKISDQKMRRIYIIGIISVMASSDGEIREGAAPFIK
jgi:hypothetical protein